MAHIIILYIIPLMKTDRKTKNELRKERRPSEQKKKESENQYNIFESFLCILFIDFTLLG